MTILFAVLRLTLAVVFAVSAFAKLADRRGFRSSLASFGIPDPLRSSVASLVPVLELLIAIGLLPAMSAWLAAVGALGLLLVFTLAITTNLARGRRPECHCFGQLSSAPAGWGSVARNIVLMAAAIGIAVRGNANAGPSLVAWVTRLPVGNIVVLAAGVIVVAVVGIESWLLTHVLRQNGRLLLRLEGVERSLARAGLHAAPAAGLPITAPLAGLPQGIPAPAFQLDRFGGGTSTSADLLALGKPIALTFLDPNCGPCTTLLPELERWQRELATIVTLVIITRGTVTANSPKLDGRGFLHILLQKNREVSDAYRAYGTPSMVLVEADGTIGSPAVGGSDAIGALMARFTVVTRSADGVVRPGRTSVALNGSNGAHGTHGGSTHPHIGEAAPDIHLPDLDGRQVSLAAFRGQDTLVLFWNPACGFCLRMLDDLKAWEASRADASPRLLVVSTGSAETNRAMGLRSPVVLDAGFESARAFGTGGTPSAVLLDKDGRIASEVAVGSPAVLTLAAKPVTMLKI